MSDWGLIQWVAAVVAGVFAVYCIARLVSAAYFMSKHDHEQRQQGKR